MDPLSIVTLVNASACLALKCGKVSTDLNTLINKYKRAELSILALSNECQTMRTVLSKIESAFNASDNDFPVDDDVLIQLDSSLNFGQMVISALEKDLAPLHDLENAEGFTKKSGIVFNDAILRTYKDHVRGQLLSLTCLLEVLKLPSLHNQRETLSAKEPVFRSARSSVWTIVNSRASSVFSTDSLVTEGSAELMYKHLSFEDLLFTTNVYKRNFRPKVLGQMCPKRHDGPQNPGQRRMEAEDDDGSSVATAKPVTAPSFVGAVHEVTGHLRSSTPPKCELSEDITAQDRRYLRDFRAHEQHEADGLKSSSGAFPVQLELIPKSRSLRLRRPKLNTAEDKLREQELEDLCTTVREIYRCFLQTSQRESEEDEEEGEDYDSLTNGEVWPLKHIVNTSYDEGSCRRNVTPDDGMDFYETDFDVGSVGRPEELDHWTASNSQAAHNLGTQAYDDIPSIAFKIRGHTIENGGLIDPAVDYLRGPYQKADCNSSSPAYYEYIRQNNGRRPRPSSWRYVPGQPFRGPGERNHLHVIDGR